MFSGSVTDIEVARKAASSVLQAQALLGLVDGSMTTIATAQAQCDAGQLLLSITDRNYAVHSDRAIQVGVNEGAAMGGTIATYLAALPDSAGHYRRMIS
jgi:hypothetical protein